MIAPFPYFGGKRSVAGDLWKRLGAPLQYIEPFCGSAAVLLAAPRAANLEVICDASGFIANFWRAVKHQPDLVAGWADYPVSHIDLGARHVWLMAQRERVGGWLQDPDWPGDPKVAGWWLWGQCCWIGSGWCDWAGRGPQRVDGQIPFLSSPGMGVQAIGQVPHAGNAGRGVQALGQVPHVGDAGMGVQALGKIPHAGDAGRGVQAIGQVPNLSYPVGIQARGRVPGEGDADPSLWTSAGRAAWECLHRLAARLERVRVVHGSWDRCLNNHYGGADTAVFLDPPYRAYEKLYGVAEPVADQVAAWAAEHPDLRIALCGHRGDYELPGWEPVEWSRGRMTYGGGTTTDEECVWYSPACLPGSRQLGLFEEARAS
jgi:DNA adenine methylase